MNNRYVFCKIVNALIAYILFFTSVAICTFDQLTMPQKKIVTIGSSMPITGQLDTFALSMYEGIFAALYSFNNASSSNVPYIREYILDDMYIPYRTYANVQFFESKKIHTLLMPLGTVNIESYLPDIKAGKLLVLFPIMEGRYPDIKNLIHYRASYTEEARALVNYIAEKTYFKQCVIFYQNDNFGIGPRDSAHIVLKKKNITWIDVPYDRSELTFVAAAEKIKKINPDVIAFFCLPNAAFGLIKKLQPHTLANKKFFGLSDLLVGGFAQYAYTIGLDFTFAAITPNPEMSDLQIAQEYRLAMQNHAFKLDMISFEGFIITQLFLEAFKTAQYSLDIEKIIKYFENIHNISFKGLPLSFSKDRSLSKTVWITEGPRVDWKPYAIVDK